eukprot:c33779_g1_i1.p1 GENE.c33779_g1_i1~~c33779_g1_i1.p1  ORF type:complete len:171 (-),score=27.91 c33779_g1_i1:127-639(-)
MSISYCCPNCNKKGKLENGTFSCDMNITLTGNGPVETSIKCTDCDRYLVVEIVAKIGETVLLPGDWLMTGDNSSSQKQHFIYIGNGQIVGRQSGGDKKVVSEDMRVYQGKKTWLIYRGGAVAANNAKSRIGEYLVSSNSELFVGECCSRGAISKQVDEVARIIAAGFATR